MIVHFEFVTLAFSPIKLLSCPDRDLDLRSKSAACLAAVLFIIDLKQPVPHLIKKSKIRGVFCHWSSLKKFNYRKPRLGESTLT